MNQSERKNIQVPKTYQLALEVFGVFDVAKLLFQIPNFKSHPKGKGETILVLPGYATDDNITFPLRKYLEFIGYKPRGWEIGTNHGHVPSLLSDIQTLVTEIFNSTGEKIILIGWSLGGYLAREIARDNPDKIESIISIGSPIFGGPKYTSIGNYYAERQNIDLDQLEQEIDERFQIPIKQPGLSIYSKKDNVVSWQASIDNFSPNIKNIEMDATHLGLILNPEVYFEIAKFLTKEPTP